FGEHVIPEDLEALGFLPHGAGSRVQAIGNASLHGASLLLNRPELRAPLARWSAACTVLDLTADPHFTANYMRHMRFT
ncbi:MAG: ASKHA domain-containing protein, partial [Desulfovibrionaceae bacterium]